MGAEAADGSPRVQTSKRRIVYRPSSLRVEELVLQCGDTKWNVAAVHLAGQLVVWAAAGGDASLRGAALSAGGAATTLLQRDSGAAAALAGRLARRLRRPVLAALGRWDRFSAPLFERGLAAHLAADSRVS